MGGHPGPDEGSSTVDPGSVVAPHVAYTDFNPNLLRFRQENYLKPSQRAPSARSIPRNVECLNQPEEVRLNLSLRIVRGGLVG